MCHISESVQSCAQALGDHTIEARAYAGLGHAARCMSDYAQAQTWHEKQLDMALTTKDEVSTRRIDAEGQNTSEEISRLK